VQDQQKIAWRREEVVDRLCSTLKEALGRVTAGRERFGVDWRTAAQAVAIERGAEASRLRTVFP
jgi:glutamate dehydrogenase/leucine dehydrogenase